MSEDIPHSILIVTPEASEGSETSTDTQTDLDVNLGTACSNISSNADRLAIVTNLLKRGACVNSKIANSTGLAPLHYAAQEGNIEMAKLLISHGADVNVLDNYNGTPLHDAALYSAEMAQYLIERGADMNMKTVYSRTPLHIAAWNGKESTVAVLVFNGCTLDGLDQLGETALDKYLPRIGDLSTADRVVSCIVFHGATRCLDKNYAKTMELIQKSKDEIIDTWPIQFRELPKKWQAVILEFLFVLGSLNEFNIPKELRDLMLKFILQTWPIALKPWSFLGDKKIEVSE